MLRTFALLGALSFAFQAQGDAKKEATERKLDAAPPAASSATAIPPPLPSAATRDTQVTLIRARYADVLNDPAVIAELRLHARRVARLNAMDRVARAAGKEPLLTRIDALRRREEARLEQRMVFLRQQKESK